IPGVTSLYGSLVTADGLRLRTIVTRPDSATGRTPALYFLQWLSCDSIEYPLNPEDHGWQQMLQLLAARSGVMTMRTDKAGIGDSEGDCAELDYNTELEHHRQALAKLATNPLVDGDRIVIFGASMGGNMAALLAAEFQPAGLVIWGTAIKSWFEHLVEFNRRHLELSGRPPAEISTVVNRQISFLEEFLIARHSPAEIAAANPALGAVWGEIRGSSGATLYGRPYRFHQQAQAKDWLGAISRVRAPTLVLYGEYDWFEELDDHVLIARVLEKSRPGSVRLVIVPGMDHHFSIYPSLEAAYRAEGGFVSPQRPVMEIVALLRSVVGAGD
ncbi:MAG: alpha/beta hydrolase family protein, partial [Steroidobacteraceae bacterium]